MPNFVFLGANFVFFAFNYYKLYDRIRGNEGWIEEQIEGQIERQIEGQMFFVSMGGRNKIFLVQTFQFKSGRIGTIIDIDPAGVLRKRPLAHLQ